MCYGSGKFGFERKIDEKCFIIMVIIIFLGKGDNCVELLVFRKFRDIYVFFYYNKDVDYYYILVLKIVLVIEKFLVLKVIYVLIWEIYLERVYRYIFNDNNIEVYNFYKKMVLELEE